MKTHQSMSMLASQELIETEPAEISILNDFLLN